MDSSPWDELRQGNKKKAPPEPAQVEERDRIGCWVMLHNRVTAHKHKVTY